MKIKTALKSIGLTEKESEIYKATLELGNGSVIDIAKQSGIPKSTVAEVLDKLVKADYLKKYIKNNKGRYTVSDPSLIMNKLRNQQDIFSSVLPEIIAMYNKGADKPRVQFYEGVWGVKKLLNEILDEAKSLKGFSSPEEVFAGIPEIISDFVNERVKRKIPIQLIFTDSKMARERHGLRDKVLRESKIINIGKQFTSTIWIWENKVAIISHKDNYISLLIESEEISQTLLILFNSMWQFHPEITN